MTNSKISEQIINNNNRDYYSSQYSYDSNVMIRVSNHLPRERYLLESLEDKEEIDCLFVVFSADEYNDSNIDVDQYEEDLQESLSEELDRDITVEVLFVSSDLCLEYLKSRIKLHKN